MVTAKEVMQAVDAANLIHAGFSVEGIAIRWSSKHRAVGQQQVRRVMKIDAFHKQWRMLCAKYPPSPFGKRIADELGLDYKETT